MQASLLGVLTLGFLLGIKHAWEPDHLIAVSTIAAQSGRVWRAALTGVFWGIGHTATLFCVGLILVWLKVEMSDKVSLSLELLVGFMLVYLGLASLLRRGRGAGARTHVHPHRHGNEVHTHFHAHEHVGDGHPPGHQHSPPGHEHEHAGHDHAPSYMRSLAIGLVHGLAGSGALVVLAMSTVSTVAQAAGYMLAFGGGTCAGMLLSTTIIGLPFVIADGKLSIRGALTSATAVLSTAFGVYYVYQIAFTDGLLRLWLP